jgi:hypothetical protein
MPEGAMKYPFAGRQKDAFVAPVTPSIAPSAADCGGGEGGKGRASQPADVWFGCAGLDGKLTED